MVEDKKNDTCKGKLYDYNEFLLKEYDNIAQAHFNTKQTLTAFFRYYLLIVALPLPFITLFFEKVVKAGEGSQIQQSLVSGAMDIAPFLSMAIGIVGIFVMLYMANLHFEALLYARQVNGIRWYFYKLAKENGITDFNRLAVLPINNKEPRADDGHSFSFVVCVFIVIDALYLFYPIYHYFASVQNFQCVVVVSAFIAIIVSIVAHRTIFKINANRYENKWQNMFNESIIG